MRRSKHNLSHTRLTTMDMGVLLPVSCVEVLAGDTIRGQSAAFIRVAPLVSPVMHPVQAVVHWWYCPNRILWDNWEKFFTDTQSGLTLPKISVGGGAPAMETLYRHLGAGIGNNARTLTTLPLRAYNKIWNEFYRDQELDQEVPVRTGDADDVATDYKLLRCRWEKDYFTTTRPFAQQGSEAVANLDLNFGKIPLRNVWVNAQPSLSGGMTPVNAGDTDSGSQANMRVLSTNLNAASGSGWPYVDGSDLEGSGSVYVNDLRRQFAIQKIREKRMRFGDRYSDVLASMGISIRDDRLQRPEYCGGGRASISFSEVLSTAATTEAALGDMAGHGIGALRTRRFKRFFPEHGWLLALMYVRPKTMYANQVPRKFLRETWEDFWTPEGEVMGEQAVPVGEVYSDAADPAVTFGYMPRHDEYRRMESYVAGEFRDLLDTWHMARDFDTEPVLNSSFVECTPTDRIYQTTLTHQLQIQLAHRLIARRLVKKFAKPGGLV